MGVVMLFRKGKSALWRSWTRSMKFPAFQPKLLSGRDAKEFVEKYGVDESNPMRYHQKINEWVVTQLDQQTISPEVICELLPTYLVQTHLTKRNLSTIGTDQDRRDRLYKALLFEKQNFDELSPDPPKPLEPGCLPSVSRISSIKPNLESSPILIGSKAGCLPSGLENGHYDPTQLEIDSTPEESYEPEEISEALPLDRVLKRVRWECSDVYRWTRYTIHFRFTTHLYPIEMPTLDDPDDSFPTIFCLEFDPKRMEVVRVQHYQGFNDLRSTSTRYERWLLKTVFSNKKPHQLVQSIHQMAKIHTLFSSVPLVMFSTVFLLTAFTRREVFLLLPAVLLLPLSAMISILLH